MRCLGPLLLTVLIVGAATGCRREPKPPLDAAIDRRDLDPAIVSPAPGRPPREPEDDEPVLPPQPGPVTDGYLCTVTFNPQNGWLNFELTEEVECGGRSRTYSLARSGADVGCSNYEVSPGDLREQYRALLDGLIHRVRYVVDHAVHISWPSCLQLGTFRQDAP